ncbi:acetolactate synthase small subunit [Thermodesulfitimonas autotrophica]|uniref:Acetolactate synthase small subunit n=1 Tax=Thermodesulfitimonas autotrophica TaxID=1894989 RepID=A0A3N5BFN9_9THEO|nr:acetolactate synthase small subunit [Thermodesulfitimonas autotrophica]RPF42871.1 acetolactate synthase small subunit [Thermodesulfitimonas autotrophica]
MRHTLAVLVENNPGVLARVAGLFGRRGFNIESLAVGETENPAISRMTIVVAGDDRVLEQVTKQLRKLVEVIKVQDVTRMEYVDRELALIKVNAEPSKRAEIIQIVEIFRAHIVDIGRKTLVVEVTGDEGKINALVNALKPFGIREMVRTGKVAMLRGTKDIITNGREAEA